MTYVERLRQRRAAEARARFVDSLVTGLGYVGIVGLVLIVFGAIGYGATL